MVKKLGLLMLALLLIGNSITATASRALMAMPAPIALTAPAEDDRSDLPCHSVQTSLHSTHSDNSEPSDNNQHCQQSLCKILCLWQPLTATGLSFYSHAGPAELISTPTSRAHIGFTDNLLRPPKAA